MTKLECPQMQNDRWLFGGHLGYLTKPIYELGREFDIK